MITNLKIIRASVDQLWCILCEVFMKSYTSLNCDPYLDCEMVSSVTCVLDYLWTGFEVSM